MHENTRPPISRGPPIHLLTYLLNLVSVFEILQGGCQPFSDATRLEPLEIPRSDQPLGSQPSTWPGELCEALWNSDMRHVGRGKSLWTLCFRQKINLVGGFKDFLISIYGMSYFPLMNSYCSRRLLHHQAVTFAMPFSSASLCAVATFHSPCRFKENSGWDGKLRRVVEESYFYLLKKTFMILIILVDVVELSCQDILQNKLFQWVQMNSFASDFHECEEIYCRGPSGANVFQVLGSQFLLSADPFLDGSCGETT